MRVLFTTTGYSGHVLPLVPLAHACLNAGHDVLFAGPRSRGAVVERAGIAFRAFGDPPAGELAALQAGISGLTVAQADARAIGDGFARIGIAAALGDVLEIVGAWRPDVVVRESYEFAGFLAAELHGIPHVRVALGLAASETGSSPTPQRRSMHAAASSGSPRTRAASGCTARRASRSCRSCWRLPPPGIRRPTASARTRCRRRPTPTGSCTSRSARSPAACPPSRRSTATRSRRSPASPDACFLERPGADLIAALPGVVRRVVEDPSYRHAARGVATAIRALPPAGSAATLLPSPGRAPRRPTGRDSARRTARARVAGRRG